MAQGKFGKNEEIPWSDRDEFQQLTSIPTGTVELFVWSNGVESRLSLAALQSELGGTPSSHANSHAPGGSDPLVGYVTMVAFDSAIQLLVADDDPRLSDARIPTDHASSHAPGSADELTGYVTDDELVAALSGLGSIVNAGAPGLMPQLNGEPGYYLNGEGDWADSGVHFDTAAIASGENFAVGQFARLNNAGELVKANNATLAPLIITAINGSNATYRYNRIVRSGLTWNINEVDDGSGTGTTEVVAGSNDRVALLDENGSYAHSVANDEERFYCGYFVKNVGGDAWFADLRGQYIMPSVDGSSPPPDPEPDPAISVTNIAPADNSELGDVTTLNVDVTFSRAPVNLDTDDLVLSGTAASVVRQSIA